MSVPQDIRAVPRPKNTVVIDTGGKGPLRYCVRERNKAVRTAKGFQPRNGKVIGHIVDGAFVPVRCLRQTWAPICAQGLWRIWATRTQTLSLPWQA